MSKNTQLGVLRQMFVEKSQFRRPNWPWNHFSRAPLNFSRRDASSKYPYDYILVLKDFSSFSRKSEKLSKSRLFLGCCNLKRHICHWVILGTSTTKSIWNLFFKQICVYHLCTVHNWSFSEYNAEKNWLFHFSDPLDMDIFHVERSENQKHGTITLGSWGRTSGTPRPPCVNASNSWEIQFNYGTDLFCGHPFMFKFKLSHSEAVKLHNICESRILRQWCVLNNF